MEIDEIDGNNGHIYCLEQINEIQEMLTTEIYKRNELSTKYNRGVNIIRMIDTCLAVTAIGLRITGVGFHFRWRIFTNFIEVWNVHTNERRP